MEIASWFCAFLHSFSHARVAGFLCKLGCDFRHYHGVPRAKGPAPLLAHAKFAICMPAMALNRAKNVTLQAGQAEKVVEAKALLVLEGWLYRLEMFLMKNLNFKKNL